MDSCAFSISLPPFFALLIVARQGLEFVTHRSVNFGHISLFISVPLKHATTLKYTNEHRRKNTRTNRTNTYKY